jgi:putative glutamine amidotransferase
MAPSERLVCVWHPMSLMARPVIGICTALERARWSVWDQQAALLPRNYVEAVQAAGGLALMIPPDPALVEDPAEVLELIDGLMLAGGVDIDPASYGEPRHRETTSTVPERDVFELALLRAAIARELPVLGICRGMQLINVAHGGTLFQHLPERFGHHEHCRVAGSFDDADHDVLLAEGSLVARIVGDTSHATKSHHHQGVDRLGEGLVVTGTSAMDGLPEALELDGAQAGGQAFVGELDGDAAGDEFDGSTPRSFLLGVQWHPEADETSPVVAGLVAAASEARAVREQPYLPST